MDDDRWLHAEMAPPPNGPQARGRGEVSVISSDGGVTVEVTVRQLALPQGAEVLLRCGDHELTRFTVSGGSGSHGHTLDATDEGVLEEGAEVMLHRTDPETVGSGGVVAVDEPESALLYGVLRETGGAG